YVARFSNRAAELVSFQLTNYKAKDRKTQVELVKARDLDRTDFPFAIEARDAALTNRLNTALYALQQREERGDTILEYRYAGADRVGAIKRARFTPEHLILFPASLPPPNPHH